MDHETGVNTLFAQELRALLETDADMDPIQRERLAAFLDEGTDGGDAQAV